MRGVRARSRARSRRSRARCRPRRAAPDASASRPARKPNSRYAVLRSRIVVPRRFASGNVRYGTCRTWMCGEANGSAVDRRVIAGGGVMSVTSTSRAARCRTRSRTDRSSPPTPCSGIVGARDDGDAKRRARGSSCRPRAAAAIGTPARPVRRPTSPRTARARRRARRAPSDARSRSSPASRARSRENPPGSDDSSPVTPALDDVARAAGVHRGDRHAERRGFDQHAAQRLGTVRRKREQRRVRASSASVSSRSCQPSTRSGTPSAAPRPRAPRAAGRRRRRRAARRCCASLDGADAGTARPCSWPACRRTARTARRIGRGAIVHAIERASCRRDWESCRAACRRAPARARADRPRSRELTAMTAPRRRQRPPLRPQVRAHVRNQRPRGDGRRARARPDAPRHHRAPSIAGRARAAPDRR